MMRGETDPGNVALQSTQDETWRKPTVVNRDNLKTENKHSTVTSPHSKTALHSFNGRLLAVSHMLQLLNTWLYTITTSGPHSLEIQALSVGLFTAWAAAITGHMNHLEGM